MKEIMFQIVLKMYLKVTEVSGCNFWLKSYKKLLVSLTGKHLCVINTIDGEKRHEE